MFLDGEHVVAAISFSGKNRTKGNGADAGQSAQPLEEGFVKDIHLFRSGVFLFRKTVVQRQYVVRHASNIGRAQTDEAPEQQTRADQHTNGNRDLDSQ